MGVTFWVGWRGLDGGDGLIRYVYNRRASLKGDLTAFKVWI